MGQLLIVPTPIGNLGDITKRAEEALSQAELILAEDTRTTGKLLKLLDISAPLKAYHMHNEHATLERSVELIAQAAGHVALVSDAGTPGISDPGYLLIRGCIQAGIEVIALPGANAVLPALVASGLPCDRFVFEGFLPAKKGRASRIQQWVDEPRTVALYESPHRLARTLRECATALGDDRPACVAREISKIHETYHRGTLGELAELFANQNAKGEIVLVIGGRAKR